MVWLGKMVNKKLLVEILQQDLVAAKRSVCSAMQSLIRLFNGENELNVNIFKSIISAVKMKNSSSVRQKAPQKHTEANCKNKVG